MPSLQDISFRSYWILREVAPDLVEDQNAKWEQVLQCDPGLVGRTFPPNLPSIVPAQWHVWSLMPLLEEKEQQLFACYAAESAITFLAAGATERPLLQQLVKTARTFAKTPSKENLDRQDDVRNKLEARIREQLASKDPFGVLLGVMSSVLCCAGRYLQLLLEGKYQIYSVDAMQSACSAYGDTLSIVEHVAPDLVDTWAEDHLSYFLFLLRATVPCPTIVSSL